MRFGQRKRKRRRKSPDNENKDFISTLPDEVLGQILSLLPSKCAVATSILSSKWRDLYKLSDNLDFDDSMYFNSREDLGNVHTNSSFREFMDGVLARCKTSQINKFRFKCRRIIEYSLVRDWINAALSHNITELELSFQLHIFFVLHLFRSTCKALVVLKLDCNLTLRVPKFARFPHLKVLFCKEITFAGDSSVLFPSNGELPRLDGFNGILHGCPLLEELVITGCNWNGGDLYISNSLLKRLTLDVGLSGPIEQMNGALVYFNLPSLVYLRYCDSLPEQYAIRNLNSVMEAHFEVAFSDDEFDDPQDLCDTMLDLIIGVRYCDFLFLSRQCLEALTSGEFKLPIFQNLTRLELCQGVDVSWNDVLLSFLTSSPCLEVLTLVLDDRFDDHITGLVSGWNDSQNEGFLLTAHPVPSCVTSRLKIINIKDIMGLRPEMDLAAYFLKHSNALVEMAIHWHVRTGVRHMLLREKEILKFPKASKTCSVTFD